MGSLIDESWLLRVLRSQCDWPITTEIAYKAKINISTYIHFCISYVQKLRTGPKEYIFIFEDLKSQNTPI